MPKRWATRRSGRDTRPMSTSFECARQKTGKVDHRNTDELVKCPWLQAVTVGVLPLSARNRSRAGFLLTVVIFGLAPSGFPRGFRLDLQQGPLERCSNGIKMRQREHTRGYNGISDSSLAAVMFPCHSYSTSVWKGRVQMQLWRTGLEEQACVAVKGYLIAAHSSRSFTRSWVQSLNTG